MANYKKNNIDVLLGNGDGTFRAQTTYSTGNSSAIASIDLTDFNNDSYVDITVANYDGWQCEYIS